MWYSLIIILVLFIVAFIGFTGYILAKDSNNSAWEQLSKIELNNQLQQLPPNPDTFQKPVGAMCYKVASPPERTEYICPVCGEMTLYPSYTSVSFAIGDIAYYRTLVKKITKIDVQLDESQFCQKCSPNAESRELCLIVKYDKDSKPHKTCNFSHDDLILLYEYSAGIKDHYSYNKRVPLSNYKTRLEELLGIKIKDK